jgi:hypothetical protein
MIHKYAYLFFSYAVSRIHLLLKENIYFIKNIKFCMTYAYIIQYAFILLPL